jgi:hypothetical protein
MRRAEQRETATVRSVGAPGVRLPPGPPNSPVAPASGHAAAKLPLDHPGLERSRRPAAVPPGSGPAGGVLAVRGADLVDVDTADDTGLLAPATAGRGRGTWRCGTGVQRHAHGGRPTDP